MSLSTQIAALVDRIAAEFKTGVYTKIGTLASLTTTAKGNLVAAINEVAGRSAGVVIDDTAPSLTKVYSSTKTATEITAAINALVDGAPGALDTLREIAEELEGNAGQITDILSALGNRVRFDAAQVLTAPQQLQARENIGAQSAADIGDTTVDLVAQFEAALV